MLSQLPPLLAMVMPIPSSRQRRYRHLPYGRIRELGPGPLRPAEIQPLAAPPELGPVARGDECGLEVQIYARLSQSHVLLLLKRGSISESTETVLRQKTHQQ